MGKGEGFWVTPEGKVIAFDEHGRTGKWSTHIGYIVGHPDDFGMTVDGVQQCFTQFKERIGSEGNARDALIRLALRKGWVRIRGVGGGYVLNVECWQFDRQTKRGLLEFCKKIKNRYGPMTSLAIKELSNDTTQIFELQHAFAELKG